MVWEYSKFASLKETTMLENHHANIVCQVNVLNTTPSGDTFIVLWGGIEV